MYKPIHLKRAKVYKYIKNHYRSYNPRKIIFRFESSLNLLYALKDQLDV